MAENMQETDVRLDDLGSMRQVVALAHRDTPEDAVVRVWCRQIVVELKMNRS